jgi:hypothetical protein
MEMIRVPLKAEEFRPAKQADLITEGASFLRVHWNEVMPHFQIISGEAASVHGSLPFDEAACAFKIQEIAKANGFAVLSRVPAAKMWLALRYAYRRVTGISVHQLEAQNKQLRALEHKKDEN